MNNVDTLNNTKLQTAILSEMTREGIHLIHTNYKEFYTSAYLEKVFIYKYHIPVSEDIDDE